MDSPRLPRAYRRQQGSEIASTYTSATAGATSRETLRETLDVIGHGLRVRLGLTSERYLGAALASAVPYILGSIAALSGYMLYLLFDGGINAHHEYFDIRILLMFHPGHALVYAPVAPLIAAATVILSALAGRWSWVRWSAAATAIAAAATILVVFELRRGQHIYVLTTFPGFELPLMLLTFAVMLLAAPTDAIAAASAKLRLNTVAVALAVTALLHLAWVREGFAWSLITAMPAVVAAVLVLTLAAGLRNHVVPAPSPWPAPLG